jgi:hypothetical protein
MILFFNITYHLLLRHRSTAVYCKWIKICRFRQCNGRLRIVCKTAAAASMADEEAAYKCEYLDLAEDADPQVTNWLPRPGMAKVSIARWSKQTMMRRQR